MKDARIDPKAGASVEDLVLRDATARKEADVTPIDHAGTKGTSRVGLVVQVAVGILEVRTGDHAMDLPGNAGKLQPPCLKSMSP
jgi:hypothetical protein